jgi:hypothetical protein
MLQKKQTPLPFSPEKISAFRDAELFERGCIISSQTAVKRAERHCPEILFTYSNG